MTEAISKLSQDSITAHHLNLWYGTDGKTSAADRGHHALKDINVEIPAHEITALIGPSGCGKSTFLKTLNRMNDLVPGVKIDGRGMLSKARIFSTKTWTPPGCASEVGMVFQKANPFPMSIYDNVAYGPRTHGIRNQRGAGRDRGKVSAGRGHLGRGEGPAEKERPGAIRRPAAAAVHRPCPGGRAGRAAHGRVHLRPGPHLHVEDRGAGCGAEGNTTPSSWSPTTCSRPSVCRTSTAFFLLGELVEFGDTDQIFSVPKDKRTEEYITGRFG